MKVELLPNIEDAELNQHIQRQLRRLGLLIPDTWLTPREAAQHARLSKAHLLRLCRQGRGPDYSGAGKLMRFRRSAVDHWLDGRVENENETENSK
jgi:excisionase family DNA binding protein